MTTKVKTNTGLHEAQEPHSAVDCQINSAPHNHPEMDCGHYVGEGPGTVPVEERPSIGPDGNAPHHNSDQDPGHGPGAE